MVLNVSFQGLKFRFFSLEEHYDAMYSGHVGITKTWKRCKQILGGLRCKGPSRAIKSYEIFNEVIILF